MAQMLYVLKLELWKQRKTFFSTLFVLTLGVAIPAALLPMVRSVRAVDSLSGAAAFLVLLMPIVIVFFGASVGASLRKTEDRNHEELLPVHPFVRVYGGYLASLFYAAVISLLAFSSLGIREVFTVASYRVAVFELPFETLLLYAMSLHCLSFGISYILNLPFLSAGVALILATIDLFFRILFLYSLRYFDFDPLDLSVAMLILPVIFALISPAIAASRLERGLPLGFKTAIPLVLCFMVLPAWTLLIVFSKSVYFWDYIWVMVAQTL